MVELSAADKAAITETWGELKKDMGKNGAELLAQVFQSDPSTQNFFAFAKGKSLADAKADPAMLTQGQLIMNKMENYVAKMDDNAALAEEVKQLTATHIPRGIKTAEFEKVRAVYGKFLKVALGAKSTPEVEAAWDKMLQVHNALFKQAEA